jgi:hypothetical protein
MKVFLLIIREWDVAAFFIIFLPLWEIINDGFGSRMFNKLDFYSLISFFFRFGILRVIFFFSLY